MNDYLVSVLLGIVEGLTEFLPVSSTAHLRLSEVLLNVPLSSGYWKMYSIVIQLGAILVLPIYFRHHIAKLLSTFPEGEEKDCDYLTHPLSLVMIAFVVTAIPSFLLTKVIGKNLESLFVMGAALLIGGIVMWIIDAMKAPWEKAGPDAPGSPIHTWTMDKIHGGQAIWIGALPERSRRDFPALRALWRLSPVGRFPAFPAWRRSSFPSCFPFRPWPRPPATIC